MNLWGGRFTKPTDQLVYDFNASISFDQTFYTQDIQGSIAHVKMLAKQGILTSAEGTEIETALNQILEDLNTGKLTIDNSQEDIHSFVESTLFVTLVKSYILEEAVMTKLHSICVYIHAIKLLY